MEMNTSRHLDATFAALADPTRRAILARLASGPAAVTERAKPFAMSQPPISQPLQVRERAGARRGGGGRGLVSGGRGGAGAAAPAGGPATCGGQRLAGGLPPVLGGQL